MKNRKEIIEEAREALLREVSRSLPPGASLLEIEDMRDSIWDQFVDEDGQIIGDF